MIYYCKSDRLEKLLRNDILSGRFDRESWFPSEVRLCELYTCSRQTIRRVLSVLEQDAILVRAANRRLKLALRNPASACVGTGRCYTVALVMAAAPNSMTANFTHGVKRFADGHGMLLQIHIGVNEHDSVLRFLANAQEFKIDGFLLFPQETEAYKQSLRKLLALGIPVVLAEELSGVECSSVSSNDFAGAFWATGRLLEKYRRKVYFLGALEECSSVDKRYAGFCQAMRSAGLEKEIAACTLSIPARTKNTDFELGDELHQRSVETATEFLSRARTPVSILAQNDATAQDIYQACVRCHLQVGRDVMICGIDDAPWAAHLKPPLTTVRLPKEELGYAAAELLLRHMRGEVRGAVNVELSVELIERGSM